MSFSLYADSYKDACPPPPKPPTLSETITGDKPLENDNEQVFETITTKIDDIANKLAEVQKHYDNSNIETRIESEEENGDNGTDNNID